MSVGNGKRVSVGTVELEVGAVVVHAGGSVVVGAEQVGWVGWWVVFLRAFQTCLLAMSVGCRQS